MSCTRPSELFTDILPTEDHTDDYAKIWKGLGGGMSYDVIVKEKAGFGRRLESEEIDELADKLSDTTPDRRLTDNAMTYLKKTPRTTEITRKQYLDGQLQPQELPLGDK